MWGLKWSSVVSLTLLTFGDFGQNERDRCGPYEDVRVLIVTVQIVFDGGDQLPYVPKTAAAEAFVGEVPKPALHQLQPGTRRRNEVQMEPGMPPQPGLHARVLVRPVIVHDEMQIEFGRGVAIDLFEKAQELLMPMARHTVADHLAVEQAEGRKQGCRAVACAVVSHRSTTAFLQRQTRLGAIEGLDLTFLVDAQHKGFVRGIEIQANDIVELLDKVFVAAELEGLDEMRLEGVLLPNTLNRHPTDPLGRGHAADAPMGGIGRRRVQGGLDDRTDFLVGNAREAAGTRRVLFQALQPQSQKSLPPQLHGRPGKGQLLGDVLAWHPVGGHRDDPCTLHQSHGDASATCPPGQSQALLGGQQDGGGGSHAS